MYESLDNRKIECKFCDFGGEFKYEWTDDAFTVICPSCGKVNYEVSKEKIEALTQEMVQDSIEDLKKSKKRDT
jgi:Zn finger protein HypA/HybF involved in hydrogenase expression